MNTSNGRFETASLTTAGNTNPITANMVDGDGGGGGGGGREGGEEERLRVCV